jgi:D-ribose pyranase
MPHGTPPIAPFGANIIHIGDKPVHLHGESLGLEYQPSLSMLRTGILNPTLLSLIARVRHTNTLVIADRGFPFWPQIETIDLSLVDDTPTVAQVLAALRPAFIVGRAFAAAEVKGANSPEKLARHLAALEGIPLTFEPHVELKKRVPFAIGLIRTGDTTQYGNVILESA